MGKALARSRGKNLWGHLLFPDILECSLEEDSEGYWGAIVILDPATAHPQSWCHRMAGLKVAGNHPQVLLPSGMEHFGCLVCVLGQQSFVGGQHC